MAARRADAVSGALDRLYAGPLGAFVALRRELVTELRTAGDAAGARLVGAAPKPTGTAWALDQVAHHRPELVRAMLGARGVAVSAQKRGEASALRAAIRESRARTAEVLHAAREALAAEGFAATPAQVRRMGETLAAASVEGSEARRLFAEGRLTRDLGQEDPFAGLEAGPVRPQKEAAPAPCGGKERGGGGGLDGEGGGGAEGRERGDARARGRARARGARGARRGAA